MCCTVIVNERPRINCKIVDKVIGVVNLSQSIVDELIIKSLVTLTIGRIKRHALYLL